MRAKIDLTKMIFIFVFITLVGSMFYSGHAMRSAPAQAQTGSPHQKLKSDYLLMLVQCVLGLVVMFLPSMLAKRLHLAIPNLMYVVFVVFLYAGIYLGEIRSFYYRIPNWDTILHTFSGLMLGALSFSVIRLLNDADRVKLSLSPAFVALFAFCFALAMGVVWEFYEYAVDGIFGLNSQKWASEGGIPLLGRAALADTITDLFVDALGAATMSVVGYISVKYHKDWIAKLAVKRIGRDAARQAER